MQHELSKGYKLLLSNCIKMYFPGTSLIQKDIKFLTNGALKDDLFFFLLVFDKMEKVFIKKYKFLDKNGFEAYVSLENDHYELSVQGKVLKKQLEEILDIQSYALEFNGVKPPQLARLVTMLKRVEKFWATLLRRSNQLELQTQDESKQLDENNCN